MTGISPEETRARAVKAARLAAEFRAQAIDLAETLHVEPTDQLIAEAARGASPRVWSMIADDAGVRSPSETTIESAVSFLELACAPNQPIRSRGWPTKEP